MRRASETQLWLITNAVPALISYIDADLRYRFNNRTYESWFGLPVAEISGRHVRDVWVRRLMGPSSSL
jgi:PAS domain-containing protein